MFLNRLLQYPFSEPSDGVFCILDARNKIQQDISRKDLITTIVQNCKKPGVILIGIRVSESSNWSQIIEQMNIDQPLDDTKIDLIYFRISENYRLDIYDQLGVMLSHINDKY